MARAYPNKMKIETGVLTKKDKAKAFDAKTDKKSSKLHGKKARAVVEERAKPKPTTVERIKEEIKADMKKEVAASFLKVTDARGDGMIEIGGVERARHDANILRLEWAIKFPLLTPQEFLLHEKDYSVTQAHKIFEVSGGESEWRDERDKLLNGVTETMIKRNVDKLVEMNETHIKLSQLGMAKIAEMLTKMQTEPVLDGDGKLMIDPKTKRPVYRGFRSIDLVNCMNALEKAQTISRRAHGLSNEVGLQQISEAIKSSTAQQTQINIQNNMTIVEAPKSKMEQIVDSLEYEDIRDLIKERRDMKRLEHKEPGPNE